MANRFARSSVLALLLAASAGAQAPASSPASGYLAAFDRFWADVDTIYPTFPLKQVDWSRDRSALRARAAHVSSDSALAGLLLEALAPLRDVHTWVRRPDGRMLRPWRPTRRRHHGGQLGEPQRLSAHRGWTRHGVALRRAPVGRAPRGRRRARRARHRAGRRGALRQRGGARGARPGPAVGAGARANEPRLGSDSAGRGAERYLTASTPPRRTRGSAPRGTR